MGGEHAWQERTKGVDQNTRLGGATAKHVRDPRDVLRADAEFVGGVDGGVVACDNVLCAAVRELADARVREGPPQHAVAIGRHVDLCHATRLSSGHG